MAKNYHRLFIGHEVLVTTDTNYEVAEVTEDGQAIKQESMALVIQGYLIDVNKEVVVLGTPDDKGRLIADHIIERAKVISIKVPSEGQEVPPRKDLN